MKILFLALLMLLPLDANAGDLPPDSVLQTGGTFTDQDGTAFRLASRQGKAQIVAMFYTSCQYICPLIIDSAKGVEHALSESERGGLRVLLISLDAERDSPAVLRAVSRERHLDTARWTLAHTDADGVRNTAAVLGIRYRQLEGGDFNHTSAMILLDRSGRIVARTENLGPVPDPDFLAAVKRTLAQP
ncbi:SCO family protein [Arenimonas sp. GDDSR-1]|uniref:SCO family protein n=1 Tax=Arenimonas sp. GDDSR-1 TaxID=2950125 RepID=UPI002602BD2A|nr:SCO family protein [Arenimonas sp. GDDSR-1]